MQPRNPPNFSQTLYNANILYNASIRYDGIVVNYPNWDDRTIPTNQFVQDGSLSWGNATMTWGNANFAWGGVASLTTNWQQR